MSQDEQGTPVLRIAQITDTHLYADPDGRLVGLNTRHCLQQVVELAGRRRPQLVVTTGDLTHDASADAYRAVRECLVQLRAPVYCLPGNHDESAALRASMNDGVAFFAVPYLRMAGWQMIFLDSSVSGSEGGHLTQRELERLDGTLTRAREDPALIWLHHQPLAIGSRWLDRMAVDNGEAFFQVVGRHPQVRVVAWGHVHQRFEQWRDDVALLATPSTCVQFLPESEDFAVERIPPGYRWIDLYDDGRFTTGVERLSTIPGEIDLGSRGY
ncbi:MAG: 3',5'-cyclic-AMP phosphodiesterase [Gammaproteobacteria bacterium]|jgi:Icc protein